MEINQRIKAMWRLIMPRNATPKSDGAYPEFRRRSPRSELGGLPADYFARQTILVRDQLIANVRRSTGAQLSDLLCDPCYSTVGERVVEYGWIAQKLLALKGEVKRPKLLDVGCVLNNAIITDLVLDTCECIWLMNPSPEPIAYSERAAYVLADPSRHLLPDNLRFDIVTCLSTLEHVGMNNARYGGGRGPVASTTAHPEEHAKALLPCLWNLTAPGGQLCLSVPFGPFEYLFSPGDPDPIYYTYDEERLLNLLSAIEEPVHSVDIQIYKVIPGEGWVSTDIKDKEILPHAVNCVGAGGAALVTFRREE